MPSKSVRGMSFGPWRGGCAKVKANRFEAVCYQGFLTVRTLPRSGKEDTRMGIWLLVLAYLGVGILLGRPIADLIAVLQRNG